MTTAWYNRQPYRYEAKDPYGVPYQHGGYSYDTPVQLAAINNRRFAVMCFVDLAYRRAAANEFKKVVVLGPAGFLYDVEVPNPCHLVLVTPEEPDSRPTSGALRIPPRSAAVVLEQAVDGGEQ